MACWLRRPIASLLAGYVLLAAATGLAESGDPAEGPGGKTGIDRLLQLPDSYGSDVERRGGATRSEWRARFEEARGTLESAKTALTKAQDELAAKAGRNDAWTVAPPGLPAEASGDNTYQLREEVRRKRAEVQRSEARLRELDIGASLAGVPEDWRGARTEASPGNDSVPPADPAR